METPPKTGPDKRKFVPVEVGRCYRQSARERFGPEADRTIRDRERISQGLPALSYDAPVLWPSDTIEDDMEIVTSAFKRIPCMAGYRNNLTALSHKYNLYFSAYQGQIFVYVPRSVPRQRIPANPDLRLYPEPSLVAAHIEGSLDMVYAHVINHIITGFLGSEEIIVCCYDDGDVVAYNIRAIADWISSNRSTELLPRPTGSQRRTPSAREGPPSFFLRENVGKSAWGLAIHRQSRLIAVSSNRAEVTVFAPALASPTLGDFVKASNNATEATVRERSASYRIVIALGEEADNIPSVSFLDDSTGEATMVCAVDINGIVWFGDIWKQEEAVRRIVAPTNPLLRSEEFWPQKSRGWGILPLHDLDFKIVDDREQLFGLQPSVAISPPSHKCNQPVLNIHECIRAVPNNPCPVREMPLTILSATPEASNMNLAGPNILQMLSDILAQNDFHIDSDEEDEEELSSEANSDFLSNEDEEEEEEEAWATPVQELETNLTPTEVLEGNSQEPIDANMTGMATENDTSEVLAVPFMAGSQFDNLSTEDEDNVEAGVLLFEDDHISHDSDLPFEHGFEDEMEEELDEDGIDADDFDDGDQLFGNYDEGIDDDSELLIDAATPNREDASRGTGDMLYIPSKGYCAPLPTDTWQLVTWLERPQEINRRPIRRRLDWENIKQRYRMIRTFEKDLELRNLEDSVKASPSKELAILCPDAVTFGHFQDPALRPFFRASSRLNMLAHVPELSLIIVGSQIGRVLLLTPTKLPLAEEKDGVSYLYGMRPECVLPRDTEELQPLKGRRPLHGMAIAPIQEEYGIRRTLPEAEGPRRFRLLLHYRNHDILTYEITREEETDKLCIF